MDGPPARPRPGDGGRAEGSPTGEAAAGGRWVKSGWRGTSGRSEVMAHDEWLSMVRSDLVSECGRWGTVAVGLARKTKGPNLIY
jgi:hypothetical protein